MIITAGFGEVSGDGAVLDAELAALVRSSGILATGAEHHWDGQRSSNLIGTFVRSPRARRPRDLWSDWPVLRRDE